MWKRLTVLWALLRVDARRLWLALRHPLQPRWLKPAVGLMLLYLVSPIDLLPDFIPVLGYLDDVILLPALIWLAVRMIPPDVLAESRLQAEAWMAEQATRPRSVAGAVVIVVIWIAAVALLGAWMMPWLARWMAAWMAPWWGR